MPLPEPALQQPGYGGAPVSTAPLSSELENRSGVVWGASSDDTDEDNTCGARGHFVKQAAHPRWAAAYLWTVP